MVNPLKVKQMLTEKEINEISRRTAMILFKMMNEERKKEAVPELVTTAEAAKILRITPGRMRQIAYKYPHIKQGDSKQAQLLFTRSGLLNRQ